MELSQVTKELLISKKKQCEQLSEVQEALYDECKFALNTDDKAGWLNDFLFNGGTLENLLNWLAKNK